jgi:hypothetical protein
MIAERNTDLKIDSNIPGNRHAMGLDPEATVHLMNVLRDLYTKPVRAVIREYATNALDAQIEAGYTGPIEVTLPNKLNPVLIVKDRGVGLNEDDIALIYSQYGASTKRGTNDQVGMLGLGCKSALTYAQQFTIVSVKDHVRTTVVVSRDDDGGSMTVVSTIATTEGNGTEIQVPASAYDHEEFATEAAFLFSFWDEGTVLVNGEQPKRIVGLPVTDEIVIINGSQDYIVMGGVPYPCDIPTSLNNRGIAAFVPIGSVRFVPSREGLDDKSKMNQEAIADIAKVFSDHIDGAMQRTVDACETRDEALRTIVEWNRIVPAAARKAKYTYKGKDVPHVYADKSPAAKDRGPWPIIMVARRNNYHGRLSQHSKEALIGAELWPNTLWVMEYEPRSFTSMSRKKLDIYLRENDVPSHVQHIVFVAAKTLSIKSWVDSSLIIKWSDIRSIKVPNKRNPYGSDRIPGSYDMYRDSDSFEHGVEANDIDASNPVFYIDPKSYGDCHDSYAKVLTHFHTDGFTLVMLAPNRVAKFLRNFPEATEATKETRRLWDEWVSQFSKNDRLAWSIQDDYWAGRKYKKLDAKKIKDPAVRKYVRLAGRDLTEIKKGAKLFSYVVSGKAISETLSDPLADYPLFDEDCEKEHLYMYLNTAYAVRQENN